MADIVQLKTAELIRDDILSEIAAETGISDENLGSVVRTIAFALGVELDEIYFQLWKGTKASYIKHATGIALDWRGDDFGLTRIPAQGAIGRARFTGVHLTPIPAGTQIAAPATAARDEIVFVTTSAGTIIGSTGEAPIRAVNPGIEGNLAADTITYLKQSISGISAVTNPGATILGTDEESDDEFQDRILRTIDGLSKGTIPSIINGAIDFEIQEVTVDGAMDDTQDYVWITENPNLYPFSASGGKLWIGDEIVSYTGIDLVGPDYGFYGLVRGIEGSSAVAHEIGEKIREYVPAGRSERVSSASIVEGYGTVDVYIDDGTSLGPHSELVSLVQKRLRGDGTDRDHGYRGAGITLNVIARTVVLVSVTAVITVDPDYDSAVVKANVKDEIIAWFDGKRVGEDVRAYRISEIIMSVEGVNNIQSLTIDGTSFDGTTSADVTISSTEVARTNTGSVTIS
jgi:uncharacterized phage protein gp47/JayE